VYSLETGDDGFLSSLFKKLSQISKGSSFVIDSSPYTERDYVHISDVTKALIEIAEESNHNTYNIASGENINNQEISEIIFNFTGKKIQFHSDRKDTNPPRINISRFVEEFQWKPQHVNKNIESWLKNF
jgi:nucleoside-diphosphate-sugar epimerase